jgi:predicted transcriptional regulator
MKDIYLHSPTNVRFASATKRRLEKAADKFHISCADLIRSALEAKLEEWETTGIFTINSVSIKGGGRHE